MSNLPAAVAHPFDGTRLVPGYADVYPNVKIGGVLQPAAWPDNIYAAPGDPIIVAQIVKPDAPSQNVIVARVGPAGPREATVTAVPGGSSTITVTDTNNVNYTVTFGYASPAIGDRVRLLWQGRDGTALFTVGVTPGGAPASGGTVPPPAPKQSGVFDATATDSGTWTPAYNAWDHWSLGGGRVYQGGAAFGASNFGAAFYSGKLADLAGATIGRLQVRIPSRLSVGDYNNGYTLHLYVHTSPTRPGGDVNRVGGPYDVFVPAHFGGGFADIDPAAAGTLIAGGGIAIAGETYMGFNGKPQDPAAFQLRLDWSR